MKDRGWIEPIVERVVGQVLDNHVAQLRKEIVRRVTEELEAAPGASGRPSAGAATSAVLARSVAEIQLGTSQREILRALLDTCGGYAARVALFVVKGTQATGWQARGFAKGDGLKDFSLDANSPAAGKAIHDRLAVKAKAADIDARFLQEFGAPENGEAQILPLVLKDKVAALIYADAGTNSEGTLDAGSVELLVLATSAWLELNSLRKASHKDLVGETSESPRAAAAVAEPAPAFNDPFAAHAPGHAKAAAATAMAQSPIVEAPPAEVAHAASAAEAVPPAASGDDETQRKAQRFARLLVDEIKLYNQAKVAEGRKHKDLYDRLKETIEKSRSTYLKRYGNTVAGSAKYFEDEVVRSLAEDDASIMGANFRR
jgi:hypothetical protein